MGRTLFSVDALLDAAREVVLERGPRSATVAAIAEQSGAPVGSIYHRFESVDEILARAWLRAIGRAHAVWPDIIPSGVAAHDVVEQLALTVFDHCAAQPRDALLVERLGREDFQLLRLTDTTMKQLRDAEKRTTRMILDVATTLFGRTSRDLTDLLVLSIFDLPFTFIKRDLRQRKRPSPARREQLPLAVRALIATSTRP